MRNSATVHLMKKKRPVRKIIPLRKARKDVLERALEVAIRRRDKAQADYQRHSDKAEELRQELPKLAGVIAMLENYYSDEPLITPARKHFTMQPIPPPDRAPIETRDEGPEDPANSPTPVRQGVMLQYKCSACNALFQSDEIPAVCPRESCGSTKTIPYVPGTAPKRKNSARGAVVPLPQSAVPNDDEFLTGNLPGREILP